MTNVEALKALYVALGGDADDVANVSTIVGVLNAMAAKYDGESDATINPDAIANITAVLNNIIPEPTLIEKTITENGEYDPADDNADGYSSVSVNVPVPTPTGFRDVYLEGNEIAFIGYYNNAPSKIEAFGTTSGAIPQNFTVLGYVYPNNEPS